MSHLTQYLQVQMKVQWFNLYYSVYFGIKTNDIIYFVPDTDLVGIRALQAYLALFLLEIHRLHGRD